MSKINEQTTVPFWWMIVAIPTFIGAITWISFIAYTSEASAKRLEKVELRLDARDEVLIQIREDVAVIKQRLEQRR